MIKYCAYLEPFCFNQADHLIPLCDIFKAPLFVSEEKDFNLLKKYYPFNDIELMHISDISPDFLVKNFDAVFHSTFWNKDTFDIKYHLAYQKYNKKIRSIYTPHGNSDKGYYSTIMENYFDQDIALVYGDQMMDFIKNRNPDDPLDYIKIGNVRLEYYKKNKIFFDEIIKKEILNYLDPNKKTILYAPTWEDGEKSSSFFEINEKFLLDILLDCNLIIKLHPRLYDHYPGRIINFIEKFKNFNNLKVLNEFPIVYPLLEITDIYLGDYSSVGYDFLKFNRPMFFIDKHNLEKIDKKKFLHNYGINIEMKNLGNIKKIILDGLKMEKEFKKKREELYFYTFDKNITNENIIKNLNERMT
jgi:hypothetical protein